MRLATSGKLRSENANYEKKLTYSEHIIDRKEIINMKKIKENMLPELTRAYLEANGISQMHLAEATGIDATRIRKWLNGYRTLPPEESGKVLGFLQGEHYVPLSKVL